MAIPTMAKTNHHIGNTQEDIPMGFRPEDFAHLAEVLDGLYSNPILACEREYACNALESHILAGNPNPIEITLPTPFSPQLVIQDYGLGMTIDDLRNTYSQYGRSDKRGTNAVGGQLGLGSKSGLSYAPQFTVTAVKGGVRVVAIVTKDEHGLGVIKVIDTCATDTPNGVTITIPVENGDIASFASEAVKLFSFWEPGTVLVNGETPETPKWFDGALWLDTEKMTCLVRRDRLDRSYVIMGGNAYPVPDATYYDARRNHVQRRFVARLNIGDVDFTPSREEVKMTVHTKRTLTELNEYIKVSFDQALAKAVADTPTPWEEAKLRVSWERNADRLSLRAPSGSPIWEYNPSPNYGRRQARGVTACSISTLLDSNRVVVTGLPATKLSTDARARLRTFAPIARGSYIVCPTGTTGTAQLEGRPNVIKYADVLAATAPVKDANGKSTRAPKVETRYSVSTNDPKARTKSLTAKEIAALAAAGKMVLYVNPKEYVNAALLDDTTVVISLYSSVQIDRLLRFIPSLRHCGEELAARRKRIVADITEADKEQYHLRYHLGALLTKLTADQVSDPELARILTLRHTPFSATLQAAVNFGSINIPEPKRPLPDFSARYPMLSQMYGSADPAEALIYLNAKYQSLRTAEVAKAAKAAEAALATSNLSDVLAVA
jgi:hypothetical protein